MVDSSADRDPIERLADSFLTRYRAGQRPSIESVAAEHPELADEIRELLPALIELEQNLAPQVSATRSLAGQPAIGLREPPQVLGDYLILREVGRGGMGIVYEATQQSLGRHVALKVLPAGSLGGSSRLERFRLEARAAARLHHTNIVPVFGVGEQSGVHYYAMQFIRGQGLDAIVDELKHLRARGPSARGEDGTATIGPPLTHALTQDLLADRFAATNTWLESTADAAETEALAKPADVTMPDVGDQRPAASELSAESSEGRFYRGIARLGLQVAEALAYAHAEGVLHRDIKPSNLMLDARGTVWVTDFGLAKSEDAGGLTQTGDVVGTLRYMAPERFEGRSDPRSDVYSLGATLYELLTLRPPFDDPSRAGLIQRVLDDNPVPPRKLDGNIPRDLETIVLKAMAKAPGARYASAEAMAEDLRLFLADRPILARRARLSEHVWRWCRRNPAVAALTALSALLLVTVAIGSTIAAVRLQKQAVQLADQSDRLGDERNRALGLLQRAQQAEREQSRLLSESLLAQARAGRISPEAGRRFGGLRAIARAAANHPSAALRDEAIACLALADVDPLPGWNGSTPGGLEMGFDDRFERYAQIDADGTVCLRRVGDGTELRRMKGSGREHGVVRFSPDGRWLAVGRHDRGRLVVYDLSTGERALDVPCGVVHAAVAWSPNSKRLAAIRENGLVCVFDTTSWRELARFSQDFFAQDLAYDPSGSRLAVSSAVNHGVHVLDPNDGKILWCHPHPSDVQALAWHPDGQRLATACNDGLVRILDVSRTENPVVLTMAGHLSSVTDVAFHPGGDLLASHAWDGMLRLWDANTGKTVLNTRLDPGSRLQFSADGRRLASAINGSQVSVWNVAAGEECRLLRAPATDRAGPWALCFSPDDRLLASAGPDWARLWDPLEGRLLAIVATGYANSVSFTPKGDGLVAAGPARADFWPITGPRAEPGGSLVGPARQLLEFPNLSYDNAAQLVADGRQLVALDSNRGELLTASLEQPEQATRLKGNARALFLAASADGRWAATGGRKGTPVRIWDLHTRTLARELPITETRLAFSPDSRWLVLGSTASFEFLETGTWKPGPKLVRHQGNLPGPLAFSADGRLLAVAYSGTDVRLVDVATVQTLCTFTAPEANLVSCLALSTHGDLLAVGTENHLIQLWNVRAIRAELGSLGVPLEAVSAP